MLYEGNDFRSANFYDKENERRWSLRTFYKTSPLRHCIKSALIRCLGPINSSRFKNEPGVFAPSHSLYAVSWLPLAIPDGPDAKYYAFKVKRLLSHFKSQGSLVNTKGWQETFTILREIKKMCVEKNVRFIIMYAPDKPHTLLPLVKHKLPPEKLHAFMALKQKNLPPPGEIKDILLSRLQIQESVIEEFCQQESIKFVSLTEPLRQEILKGRQVYFTYDQHWTPIGHEIVADALYHYLEKNPQRKPVASQ